MDNPNREGNDSRKRRYSLSDSESSPSSRRSSTSSYSSNSSMPELEDTVFADDDLPLPSPPLPLEVGNSTSSPTESTGTVYTELLNSPIENSSPVVLTNTVYNAEENNSTTEDLTNNLLSESVRMPSQTPFSLFNKSIGEVKKNNSKESVSTENNSLLKKTGIASLVGLTAFAGIGYALSLAIPQLQITLAALSVLQMGALFFGAAFLIISSTLMVLNYINNKNESAELNNISLIQI